VLVLTGVGQAAQLLIIGLGLIRRGSFTRAVLTDNDLMAGFSCARMLDSLLRLTGAHNVYYVKCDINIREEAINRSVQSKPS
ncbi:hypothetical protein, partial [Enterobacter asburiae]